MSTPTGPPQQAAPRCYRHSERETWVSCQRCGRPICPDCMRQASVGFQCPECVAAGNKSVRQPRTLAGGLVPSAAGRITMTMIGINVVIFLVVLGSGGFDSPLIREGILFSADQLLWPDGTLVNGVDGGAYWRLLTSAFLHTRVLHLLLNMYALWIFGPLLERFLGYGRFLALYVTCAIAGSVAVLWLTEPNQPVLGASGAVFGLFGAAILILHSRGGDVTAWLVLLGINLVIGFAVPTISWQGHLGGLAAGLLLGAAVAYTPRERRAVVQAMAFGGLWVVLIAAVLVHAA